MSDNEWQVVINHEEQWWGILPLDHPVPTGCQPAGKQGSREACLHYIAEVWRDMRPLKLSRMS